MKLIVGLGNPGAEYERTPHNMGFLAIDAIAERTGIRVTRPESKSYVGRGELAGQEVALAKPQTMMNLSGVAVGLLLERYELQPADLILLVDEVDLPWGMIRIRPNGSAGTHNGMKSVVRSLATQEFARVRMGVGPEKVWGDLADYVLCPMGRAERTIASEMAQEAAEAVETILKEGVEKAMTRFNRRAPGKQEGPQ
ncbi:MAG TPA: aminoacyl-tRNA hydrolase [Candidatus Acidoferrales bacterium]|nr:aminoacyl-tRNA hydrolase [Candidatus Acidoferrales bacterium]